MTERHKYSTGKKLGRKQSWCSGDTTPEFPWRNWGNSFRVAGFTTKIPINQLQHISEQHIVIIWVYDNRVLWCPQMLRRKIMPPSSERQSTIRLHGTITQESYYRRFGILRSLKCLITIWATRGSILGNGLSLLNLVQISSGAYLASWRMGTVDTSSEAKAAEACNRPLTFSVLWHDAFCTEQTQTSER
jgi:hypothetical protein